MSVGAPAVARSRTIALIGAVLIGVALLAFVLTHEGDRSLTETLTTFASGLSEQGATGALLFALGYAVAVVAFFPASVLTLLAGALFGFVKGAALVFVGAVLGSTIAFLLSRSVLRAGVERRLAGNPRFAAVDRAIGREGRRIVFLLRLSPVFPFTALNYALGVTRVRLRDYLIASIGMLPGTLAYVYYGTLAGAVAGAVGSGESTGTPGVWALRILGLVATIAATTIVARTARRAIREATNNGDDRGVGN